MYFDDNFIDQLPDNTREAIIAICDYYRTRRNGIPNDDGKHQFALEAYAFLKSFMPARGLPPIEIQISGSIRDDINKVDNSIGVLKEVMQKEIRVNTLDGYEQYYGVKFKSIFHYEFSEGDFKKIQELLNQLRNLISESNELEEDHKHRLLKRLEKLQSELHKKVSDLDRFWGFFIDASIVVGQVGENAKPIIDVIEKIVKIVWPTQTRAYELSSDLPFKLLGTAEDNKTEDAKS